MNIKELAYLVWYSIKSLLGDFVNLLLEFKRPETWFYILMAAFMFAAYYREITVIKWLVPLILIIYIIRHKQEGKYHTDLVEKAFLKGDDTILQEEYEKYIRDCFYKKLSPYSYDEWKSKEKKEIENKKV